jgi:hypothetical protein
MIEEIITENNSDSKKHWIWENLHYSKDDLDSSNMLELNSETISSSLRIKLWMWLLHTEWVL